MRLLDLFCGAGGAAMGYRRAGFDEIVGVDIKPQPRYPFTFVLADAMTYPLDGFDVIHASPPCQAYSSTANIPHRHTLSPKLLGLCRARLQCCGVPWVIENVAAAPMERTVTLCGQAFGLRVYRHRRFETPILVLTPPHERHRHRIGTGKLSQYHTFPAAKVLTVAGHLFRHADGCAAMGIDWMTKGELSQAIPPAYTEYIGRHLLAAVRNEALS